MVVGCAFLRVAKYSVGSRDLDKASGGSRITGVVIGVVAFRKAIECSSEGVTVSPSYR